MGEWAGGEGEWGFYGVGLARGVCVGGVWGRWKGEAHHGEDRGEFV